MKNSNNIDVKLNTQPTAQQQMPNFILQLVRARSEKTKAAFVQILAMRLIIYQSKKKETY